METMTGDKAWKVWDQILGAGPAVALTSKDFMTLTQKKEKKKGMLYTKQAGRGGVLALTIISTWFPCCIL